MIQKDAYRILSVALGLFIALVLFVVTDWTFGLVTHHAQFAPSKNSSQDFPYPGNTNQQILGEAATRHGIFPKFPKPRNPHPDYSWINAARRSYSPAQSYGPWGKYAVMTFHQSAHVVVTQGEKTVYEGDYTVDPKWARRIVPGEDRKDAYDFLLLTGCSFVFGEALKDKETLAYQLSQKLPHTRVYNYGVPGGSMGEAFLRLKTVEGSEEIREHSGTVVYAFMDDHIARTLGRMSVVGSWGYNRAHFFLKNGAIQSDGPFYLAQPFRTALLALLAKSNILRAYGIDIPGQVSDSEWKFLTLIARSMKEESLRLGAQQFYVMFWPASHLSTKLIPYLEKEGISYIDYSHWDMNALTLGPARVPGDGHPSAEADQVLADSLVEELKH